MPQELILISASQRNPILWSYNVPLRNVCANMSSVFCQKVLTRIFGDFDFLTHFNRDEYYTHAVNRIWSEIQYFSRNRELLFRAQKSQVC
jgi:hypothetical protein